MTKIASGDDLRLARAVLAILPRFGRVAWDAAQRCGMASPERGKLLWVLGDRSLRAGLVAQRLRLGAPAVTELVEGLVHDGLVKRESDPDDRRAVVLALTAEGRRVRERYELAASTALVKVLQSLTPPQRRRLRAALTDLNVAFDAAATSPAILRRSFIGPSRSRRTLRRRSRKESADAR